MYELTVDPEYLRKLADLQDQAKEKSTAAAHVTDALVGNSTGLEAGYWNWSPLWRTHGYFVTQSNIAIDHAIDSRRKAGIAMAAASGRLAQFCRNAAEAYRSTDQGEAEGLARVLPQD